MIFCDDEDDDDDDSDGQIAGFVNLVSHGSCYGNGEDDNDNDSDHSRRRGSFSWVQAFYEKHHRQRQ